MMKRQLTELLAGLDPEVAFNLVSFHDDVRTWQPRLVTMDSRRRASALKEIHRYTPGSGTNLHAALDACFEMAEASLDDADEEPACPDTVFLLTDGMPTTGKILETRLLLEYVAERNRDLHLRIDGIALTTDIRPIAFIRELAQATDGDSIRPFAC